MVAMNRSFLDGEDNGITVDLDSYRSEKAAKLAMRQMREAPGECPSGGGKQGVDFSIRDWTDPPRAGAESQGNRLVVMGSSYGSVQVRVGATVVYATFDGKEDPGLVSRVTRRSAERLAAASRRS
ncbi:hypothetical protein [Streptomyces boncukensis]|uniref:Uncharacterized protein n=1 Tax=Streptomyces boncukensis TaxID=2711219 RepID=A0A6G4WY53_9ACTN|nr:hypothetical protein [Streptomyces boncukensis]NGO70165.1 hypothetical protein [Streptomyces boncukensis]